MVTPVTGAPLATLQALVDAADPPPLLELVERLLEIPQEGQNGKARKQPDRELVILVVAYLEVLVADAGLGLRFVEEAPWFYTGSHRAEISEEDFGKVLGRLAKRMGCPV